MFEKGCRRWVWIAAAAMHRVRYLVSEDRSATATWSLTPDVRGLVATRHAIHAWLGSRLPSESVVGDLVLVAGELLNNAIDAARTKVRVSLSVRQGEICIEVIDDGPDVAFPDRVERDDHPPAPSAEAGRGLYIARRLTDRLECSHDARGTRVAAYLDASVVGDPQRSSAYPRDPTAWADPIRRSASVGVPPNNARGQSRSTRTTFTSAAMSITWAETSIHDNRPITIAKNP